MPPFRCTQAEENRKKLFFRAPESDRPARCQTSATLNFRVKLDGERPDGCADRARRDDYAARSWRCDDYRFVPKFIGKRAVDCVWLADASAGYGPVDSSTVARRHSDGGFSRASLRT